MKVIKSKRKDNTVSLEIEVSSQEVQTQIQPSFKKVVKNKIVPGFRKGKANFNAYVKHYGIGEITQEATLAAINIAYLEAIKNENLDIVDYPKDVEIGEFKDDSPLKFSCNVDVKPIIKLGKYKGLKSKKEEKEVNDELIQSELKKLQENAAKYEIVDRGITKDDLVKVDVNCKEGDTTFKTWTKKDSAFQIGQNFYSEEFDKELEGLKANEEKQFSISFKNDFKNKEVAGKKLDFKIKVNEVKSKVLTELTEAFIKENSQFKSLDELKDKMKDNFTQRFKQEAEEKIKADLINQTVDPIDLEIPEGLLRQERENELQNYNRILQQSGMNVEQYLKATGKTQEDILKDMEPSIIKRVKTELVLAEIAKKEKIDVTEEDQLNEIKKANQNIKNDDEAKKILNRIDIERLNFHIKQIKVVNFLIENAKIA